jgi:hypothetical protein
MGKCEGDEGDAKLRHVEKLDTKASDSERA